MLRPCTRADAEAITLIYNDFIRDTIITFEEVEISADEMAQRISRVTERLPWFVWEQDGTVVGYAYAAPWATRSAYRYAVETTIYLANEYSGRGIGTELYSALIDALRQTDVHCAIGGVALPNPGSVALHEKLGFVKVAHYNEVGRKFGHWIDVAYWQLLL